jgi:hypothetical protein
MGIIWLGRKRGGLAPAPFFYCGKRSVHRYDNEFPAGKIKAVRFLACRFESLPALGHSLVRLGYPGPDWTKTRLMTLGNRKTFRVAAARGECLEQVGGLKDNAKVITEFFTDKIAYVPVMQEKFLEEKELHEAAWCRDVQLGNTGKFPEMPEKPVSSDLVELRKKGSRCLDVVIERFENPSISDKADFRDAVSSIGTERRYVGQH